MTIKQISLTLLSLMFVFTTELATAGIPVTYISEKERFAIIMQYKLIEYESESLSGSASCTYEEELKRDYFSESTLQRLENENGSLVCDCDIPGLPPTVKLYYAYATPHSKKHLSSKKLNCKEFTSMLKRLRPTEQKDLAEKLSANDRMPTRYKPINERQ